MLKPAGGGENSESKSIFSRSISFCWGGGGGGGGGSGRSGRLLS